jgi:hypothetical protein
MNAKLAPVMKKVDLMLLEYRQLKAGRLHFTIWHRFRAPGTNCAPGEVVAAVYLMHQGREYQVPVSSTLRLLFDFLAKNVRLSLTASQIAACFQADEFYGRHGFNIASNGKLRRRVVRSTVKVYVQRIRQALTLSFREANLRLDPCNVLASEETGSNEAGYRLRGTFDWLHTDHPGRKLRLIS